MRDKRFEAHGCAIKLDSDVPAMWVPRENLHRYFNAHTGFQKAAVLCHHAHFDGLILAHHYGVRPAAWLDTLSMARLLVGNHVSASLASLAKHFDLGTKDVPYDLFKRKHWYELSAQVQAQVAAGACHDVEITWALFKRLAASFPSEEYRIVDTTVRMFTEPVLELDMNLASEVWHREDQAKEARAAALGVDPKELRSDAKFSALLTAAGVEVPTKPGKNGPIPALAKSDDFIKDLLESDDDELRALAEARVGARSSLNQTRAERLLHMRERGLLCTYYSYAATHTTAWGGGDKLNFQNFPRHDPAQPEKNALRRALVAPDGWLLAKVDMSQIQCRILNYVAGQWDVIDRFRHEMDPYVTIASAAYGFQVTKAHPAERGTGKQLELSCGFGAGAETIQRTAARGTYGPPVHIDIAKAYEWRDLYRETHPSVVRYWYAASDMLSLLASGRTCQWGPLEIKNQRVWLPNGAPLIYDTLEWVDDEWRMKTRRGYVKMYGGKLVQNVVHAMNRVVLSQLMPRVITAGFRIVLTAHDDLVILVKDDTYAAQALAWLENQAKAAPAWLPGIPLGAEGRLGRTYE